MRGSLSPFGELPLQVGPSTDTRRHCVFTPAQTQPLIGHYTRSTLKPLTPDNLSAHRPKLALVILPNVAERFVEQFLVRMQLVLEQSLS